MRHYEIVILVHPDQSSQVQAMIDRYRATIEASSGQIHRYEDWGRRQLAYPINKLLKAHYILLNIECDQETLAELENNFRFNDAILRTLTLSRNTAHSQPSVMVAQEQTADAPSSEVNRVNETASQPEEKAPANEAAQTDSQGA